MALGAVVLAVTGAEALYADMGHFGRVPIRMQAAERFGLSYAINTWIIEEACRTLHRLNFQHIPFSISINLSHQQLRNPNLVTEIRDMLTVKVLTPS